MGEGRHGELHFVIGWGRTGHVSPVRAGVVGRAPGEGSRSAVGGRRAPAVQPCGHDAQRHDHRDRQGEPESGLTVRSVLAGLAEAALPSAFFALASAQCPDPLRTPGAAAERALLAAVAPGGVLLLVHHAGTDTRHEHDSEFDPADYVWPSVVAALLDDDWTVEVDEQRPRVAPDGGAGAHHTDDVVLRARRLR